MCGISGCLVKENAMKSVTNALSKLQNRGYDSAGICGYDSSSQSLVIVKKVSETNSNAVEYIINHDFINEPTTIAIGHTRWATHGGKTIENTHPHHDAKKEIALVHNGIIENYIELRQDLICTGVDFYGQTDTEVAAKYYHSELRKSSDALRIFTEKLKGSWAMLVVEAANPSAIYFTKSGSPLILGFNSDKSKAMFVSELVGFDSDITNYTVIADKDYGKVELVNDKCVLTSTKTYTLNKLDAIAAELTPAPYPHWTIKEIHDQPASIKRLIDENTKRADTHLIPSIKNLTEEFKTKLFDAEHVIILGCGTSYNAGQIGAKYIKELCPGKTVEVIDGSDFEAVDVPDGRPTVIVLLSQSGETKDLYRALQIQHPNIVGSLGIVNVENSLIAREVDCCLYLRAGREQAVASTKSFTNQVLMMLLLALTISSQSEIVKKPYYSAVETIASDFNHAIQLSVLKVPEFLPYFDQRHNCFVLGKHITEWIAREGSLKVKEISYIHAEGFSIAALKHGTFALLEHKTPIVLIANNDQFYTKVENIAAEVKSRAASIIQITNKKLDHYEHIDHVWYYETESVLFPLISIVPLQLLAYYLALARGNNPDYPRNLAKVVTVE